MRLLGRRPHPQRQPVQPGDLHFGSRFDHAVSAGVPALVAEPHPPLGGEPLDHHAVRADQARRTGQHPAPLRPEPRRDDEQEERAGRRGAADDQAHDSRVVSPWNRNSEPSSSEITPPAASRPWLCTLISARKNTMASRISATPAVLTGKVESAKKARMRQMPPTTPGRMAPGFWSSNSSP